ncbi:uncharacterized protein BO95DRAFT_519253 [Aspergillus brunneoviolaceus CBS 621.78]|uniref:Uncharacterized protein n=1 Tax=Aspergillus brunneoviolaceus CBS 621.78 TaxID=1450534 RepID=A0ACD1FS32_9EURO|nr:hypothetical protein BO95DRAFT_519253 [Aspergillus brunneoviolaceus CBS 621.78]RAH39782.1 hypothetical protein BO95DRAFT_519253 [Aspergillus brunneoviolaceus CBS 621.78]
MGQTFYAHLPGCREGTTIRLQSFKRDIATFSSADELMHSSEGWVKHYWEDGGWYTKVVSDKNQASQFDVEQGDGGLMLKERSTGLYLCKWGEWVRLHEDPWTMGFQLLEVTNHEIQESGHDNHQRWYEIYIPQYLMWLNGANCSVYRNRYGNLNVKQDGWHSLFRFERVPEDELED